MANKQRFQVFLDMKQLTAMRRIEDKTGAPVAAQIRLAVDAWLAKQTPTAKKGS
jgi:hypothetical protein